MLLQIGLGESIQRAALKLWIASFSRALFSVLFSQINELLLRKTSKISKNL
jgi:hypothetical protein